MPPLCRLGTIVACLQSAFVRPPRRMGLDGRFVSLDAHGMLAATSFPGGPPWKRSKTILVPIDFEEASVEALDQAAISPETAGLRGGLLHVYAVSSHVLSGIAPMIGPDSRRRFRPRATETLANFAAKHGNLAGNPALW